MTPTLRRAAAAVLLSAALVATSSAPSQASRRKDLEGQKVAQGKQLDDAKADYDEASKTALRAARQLKISQGKLDDATAVLSQTRGQLTVARAKDSALQDDLNVAQADLAHAKDELERGGWRFKESQKKVREFTLQQLADGDLGLRAMSSFLSGEDPAEFLERMSATDSVTDAQVAAMQEYAASKVMLGIRREKTQKLRDKVKADKAASAKNVAHIGVLEASASAQADEVAGLVENNEQAKATADYERHQEAARVSEIEDERAATEQKIRDLIAYQARLARKDGSGTPDFGGDGSGLVSPIPGAPITSPYGMRLHPILHVWKLHDGTDFGAACGTPIHAAGSGTVIAEYFNAGYGNRLLLANGTIKGTNIVTIYNHMSGYAVSTGAHVTKGQVIGYVGTTGYSTGCHLHFMVLANGSTVNPMGWL